MPVQLPHPTLMPLQPRIPPQPHLDASTAPHSCLYTLTVVPLQPPHSGLYTLTVMPLQPLTLLPIYSPSLTQPRAEVT